MDAIDSGRTEDCTSRQEAVAMKLTTRSRYGTRMILDIALNGQEGPVRIKDIATRQGVSIKYLEKLVRELKLAGFVTSRRGPRGGHTLARPLKEITIGGIVRALEGDFSLVDCNGGTSTCPRQTDCLTRKVWIEAAKAMHEKLDAITLADLIPQKALCSSNPSDEKNTT
jgi:Rrf2 family protein